VKAFVEMHRGRVSVASEVGSGTTFSVALPAQDRPATLRSATEAAN